MGQRQIILFSSKHFPNEIKESDLGFLLFKKIGFPEVTNAPN